MPHIFINGVNMNSNIQRMHVHVDIHFSKQYYHSNKCDEKLKEVAAAFEKVVEWYFGPQMEDPEVLSNHEYNQQKRLFTT